MYSDFGRLSEGRTCRNGRCWGQMHDLDAYKPFGPVNAPVRSRVASLPSRNSSSAIKPPPNKIHPSKDIAHLRVVVLLSTSSTATMGLPSRAVQVAESLVGEASHRLAPQIGRAWKPLYLRPMLIQYTGIIQAGPGGPGGHRDASTSGSTLLTTIVTLFVVSLPLFGTFLFLREKYHRVYAPRAYIDVLDDELVHEPPFLP